MKDFDTSALEYLRQLQGNIGRMHEASRSCKSLCIGLVSVILATSVATKNGHVAFVGLLPTVVFLLLDAYYLSLERDFIAIYSRFVTRYLEGRDVVPFDLNPSFERESRPGGTLRATFSFSVWPFYLIALIGCVSVGGVI